MEADKTGFVITDLTVCFCSADDHSPTCQCDISGAPWKRLEKDLYLRTTQKRAWLYIAQKEEHGLGSNDLVVTDIKVGESPSSTGSDDVWESRPGGIWVLKSKYTDDSRQNVNGVDVLFGSDAVDPRPLWSVVQSPLKLEVTQDLPVAKLTIRRGRAKKIPVGTPLRIREDGKFKIVQISDTHMVTGVGVCTDASDANGQLLPESEADPLSVKLIGQILDVEKPDLVIFTGDNVHYDILDSQSALLKVVAPVIERAIPFAAVFGNHDDEGENALSRSAQMSILQDLPFCLAQPGPAPIDGVGNYYLEIFDRAASQVPLSTIFLLDSHGEVPSKFEHRDYDYIKSNQIEWFSRTSQALRKERQRNSNHKSSDFHLSLTFIHIPVPEYGDSKLVILGGERGERTEGPSFNSHFYDALAEEGVVALGCGHDHVNDFCGYLPQLDDGSKHVGPWLCHSGSTGFGAYGSYGGKLYHRRARVWEIDTSTNSLTTWKRLEYAKERIDELVLVEAGSIIRPQ